MFSSEHFSLDFENSKQFYFMDNFCNHNIIIPIVSQMQNIELYFQRFFFHGEYKNNIVYSLFLF